MDLTKEQVLADFKESATDILCLETIVQNINMFIHHTAENRQSFKCDLVKYRSLLTEAQSLHGNIKLKLKEFGIEEA